MQQSSLKQKLINPVAAFCEMHGETRQERAVCVLGKYRMLPGWYDFVIDVIITGYSLEGFIKKLILESSQEI